MPICTSAGARIVLKPAEPLPPSPEVAMPTKSELLIITTTDHLSLNEVSRLTSSARFSAWLQDPGVDRRVEMRPLSSRRCDNTRRVLSEIEATTAQLADELKASVSPVVVPGELAAYSPDPLAMAISDTAGLLADATGKTAERLDKHLAQLLDIQLNRVAAHE